MEDIKEKLIELVNAVLNCLPWGEISSHTAEDIVDRLIEYGATFAEDNNVPSKWISVNDRLPEKDQIVLCYKAGRGVRIGKHLVATFADGVSAFKDCLLDYAFGATHWMPLPEPPKGE